LCLIGQISFASAVVSNGVIAISATLTSRSCLAALSSTAASGRVYRPRKLAT